MRIALLSDIHGNREAFSACLAHLARHPVDRIIFTGDVVGYGADPAWCLDTVMSLCGEGAVALLGNHDEGVLKHDCDMNAMARQAIEWTRMQMSEAHRAFIGAMPVSLEEGEVLYVHASAAAPLAWHYITNRLEANACLRHTSRRVTICGHVHRPCYFHAVDGRPIEEYVPPAEMPVPLLRARRWVVVLGSVGQPRDGNPAAAYSVFDSAQGRITMHRIPYNVEGAARKILAAGLPAKLAERLYKGA